MRLDNYMYTRPSLPPSLPPPPTGQVVMKDGDIKDEIPTSLEVGLLGLVRKIITLLPDTQVCAR